MDVRRPLGMGGTEGVAADPGHVAWVQGLSSDGLGQGSPAGAGLLQALNQGGADGVDRGPTSPPDAIHPSRPNVGRRRLSAACRMSQS